MVEPGSSRRLLRLDGPQCAPGRCSSLLYHVHCRESSPAVAPQAELGAGERVRDVFMRVVSHAHPSGPSLTILSVVGSVVLCLILSDSVGADSAACARCTSGLIILEILEILNPLRQLRKVCFLV